MYTEVLNAEKREIRVLHILPGRFNDPIRCTLSKVALADKPEYEALSYVWGDPAKTRYIIVHGALMPVTINLASALRHLRRTTEARTMWIDAICINQKDVSERSQQVSLMGLVYSTASRVVIWLGAGNPAINHIFENFEAVSNDAAGDMEKFMVQYFFMSLVEKLPWLHRVWTVQEMVVAVADPLVVYGHSTASWSMLISAWRVFSEHTITVGSRIEMPMMIDTLDNMRHGFRFTNGSREGLPLALLTLLSRDRQATDPRDRIYGVLGMLKDSVRMPYFEVDYEQPVYVVYAQATLRILTLECGPCVYTSMSMAGLNPGIWDLPSWVLDFSSPSADVRKPSSMATIAPPTLTSSESVTASSDFLQITCDYRFLKVALLPVDVIDHVIQFSAGWPRTLDILVDIDAAARAVKQRPLSDQPLQRLMGAYRSSEPLWQTLVSSAKDTVGRPASPEFEAMFDHILEAAQQRRFFATFTTDYWFALVGCLRGRAFFTTKLGFVGKAISNVQVGDEVSIWAGCRHVFVTRPDGGESEHCRLVSSAYVGGVMDGRMFNEVIHARLLQLKEFSIR